MQYKSKFNDLNAFPLSDIFIAKRMQLDPMQWLLFDAYKIDYTYDIEIFQNGIIEATENNALILNGTNFLAKRRMNLRNVHIPCGLVVTVNFLFCFNVFSFYDQNYSSHLMFCGSIIDCISGKIHLCWRSHNKYNRYIHQSICEIGWKS